MILNPVFLDFPNFSQFFKIITINCPATRRAVYMQLLLYLGWTRLARKHCKFSKCYDHDCRITMIKNKLNWKGGEYKLFSFSICVFFHGHSRFTRQQGKGEVISLTPLYYFHPLHRNLDNGGAIIAESSPLYSGQTQSGNLRFTSASRWPLNYISEE